MVKNYNDYPIAATNNAKKALRWRKEHGKEVKGGTIVGWTRANQLASRESLSPTTIARMASFARHRKNSSIDPQYAATPWKDRGHIAWLIWGGTAGVDWAIGKMEQIRKMLAHNRPQDKDMIDGIVSMLLQIKDLDNRLEVAMSQLAQFKRDGIPVNEEEFLKAVNVWSQELKEIDGEIVYETKEEAISAAKEKGCKGYHEHEEDGNIWFMPCESHDEIKYKEDE